MPRSPELGLDVGQLTFAESHISCLIRTVLPYDRDQTALGEGSGRFGVQSKSWTRFICLRIHRSYCTPKMINSRPTRVSALAAARESVCMRKTRLSRTPSPGQTFAGQDEKPQLGDIIAMAVRVVAGREPFHRVCSYA